MFCGRCGTGLSDLSRVCTACGVTLASAGRSPGEAAPGEAKTDGKAIASLVFGGLFFLFPSAVLAIILGHLSLSEIGKSGGRIKGKGLAMGGLVLGYLGVTAIPLLFGIFLITLISSISGNRTSSRGSTGSHQPSAVSSIRALNASEIGFQRAHPELGYTCKLDDLVGSGGEYGYRDPELAGGSKDGYVFVLQNCSARSPGGPNTNYQIIGTPVEKRSGGRTFCSDQSAVVRSQSDDSGKDCLQSGQDFQ
jgi:Domain of unknown function (DUF4190)